MTPPVHPAVRAPAPSPALRPPETVMRLERMGASFPTRLSFLPTLIRRLATERTVVDRALWEIDAACAGRAVYTLSLGGRRYSLAAFSSPLAPEARSDRVIAEAWDAAFVLFDGVPSRADMARLAREAPRQEAGRFTERELVLSRANRSERAFNHITARLAAGAQPDPALMGAVGYAMRTTAVYGNGKFGLADRAVIASRPELAGPFQAEMLTVWLIRAFTLDLAEHAARAASADAATLSSASRRHIGVGNATGLGMAPFLAHHPELVDQWVSARETALARARSRAALSRDEQARAAALIAGAGAHAAAWRVGDARQSERIAALEADLARLADAAEAVLAGPAPLEALMRLSAGFSLEGQELVAALAIDIAADSDDLAADMSANEARALDPRLRVESLRSILERRYGWVRVRFDPNDARYFWYVSEEKLEPRLGEHGVDPAPAWETPLDIGRRVSAFWDDLETAPPDERMSAFLMRRPEHRAMARRVAMVRDRPYAEIQDNLVGAACRPIDMLRFKLAFLGAAFFDPKSDRWTRIALGRGAPGPSDVAAGRGGDWSPVFGAPERGAAWDSAEGGPSIG